MSHYDVHAKVDIGLTEPLFKIITNQRTHMVVETATGRCLGAFGHNFYRPWVFPLYSPSGQTVIQEFPFDHPFHTGGFVSQNPVTVNGNVSNFWAMPPRRSFEDALFNHVGRIDIAHEPQMTPHASGVLFSQPSVWRDASEQPVLDENRTVDLYSVGDATMCDITSEKIATYGQVEYAKTKFGSIGIRVEPRLLPPFGGTVIADAGRRGSVDIVHEQDSDFVAYENGIGAAGHFGVALGILQPEVRGPWFIRDYGMAIYNPTWRESIVTPQGDKWVVALRIMAYDGQLNEERIARWLAAPYRKP